MPQTSREVREDLVRALRLDLIGPVVAHHQDDGVYERERLPMSPSRWYLTGFLVPRTTPDEQRADEASQEELDLAGDADEEGDEDATPDKGGAKRIFFPSSLGVSVLVPGGTAFVDAIVSWGDYEPEPLAAAPEPRDGGTSIRDLVWVRTPHSERVVVAVPAGRERGRPVPVPNSGGLKVLITARPAGDRTGLPTGTLALAVFLVNEREPAEPEQKDRAWCFQATLEVQCSAGFVPRPDPRRADGDDWDESVADLQYASVVEYASGHGVSADWEETDGACRRVWTTWTPRASVPFTEPGTIAAAMLGMESLASASASDLMAGLTPIVTAYRAWIGMQGQRLPADGQRARTAVNLLARASAAAVRIERGIAQLDSAPVRRAFQLANSAMATSARRRTAIARSVDPSSVEPPQWRPFQLAFILLNLPGLVDPGDNDREIVDLLFFPTGGGKTEAYLGLAAFTLVLRRLRHPGIASAGVSVLMRYTLRLLTLDQLGRAAGMICALEQLRVTHSPELGPWPFEIGLYVGRSATPNRIGKKGDQDENTARKRVLAFKQNSKQKPQPVPIETCPWCGTRFTKESFDLVPNADHPRDLRIVCANAQCDFTGERALPIVAVDQPLYRRLPCFVIATVDKFAGLPFEARAGALFGNVDRYDGHGFYGAADPGEGAPLPGRSLPAPDLIIQDELHLISGPLGTIAGLYETVIDYLSTRRVEGRRIRPKVVASTATVRRAETQLRALFARRGAELFPPASPDRHDSFFAHTANEHDRAPRLYVGLAAPGRSLKVVALRSYIALLTASYRAWVRNGGDQSVQNPADPYLTVLGYFNALRELGGTRRIVEDEVNSRVKSYGRERRRVGEATGLFADREIDYEVVELTSRVPTSAVAAAKRRLERIWTGTGKGERVDVALATNMISVGLDIMRLGLMVVLGQPKGSAEYIQSTSRVGRDPDRPGLVVTLLTVNKPRDRSHFERFRFYHQTFYRSVEATSVTPFAPRAIDRVLPALVVALARHGVRELTPPEAALDIEAERSQLDYVLDALGARVDEHDATLSQPERTALRQKVRHLAAELLDAWSAIAHEQRASGAGLKYQQFERVERAHPLLRDPLDLQLPALTPPRGRFKAARSMRDVEPEVLLLKRGSADGT